MKRIREQNINTVEYWDKLWEDRPPELAERFRSVAKILRDYGAHSVLDIGCGDGGGYNAMRATMGGIIYTGTDFSDIAIQKAKQDYPDALWATAEYDKQPFDDKSFDAVISQETLEHVENPGALLDEANRLARDLIIITTPLENAIRSDEHVWSFSKEDLIDWQRKHGWEVAFHDQFPGLIIAIACRPV